MSPGAVCGAATSVFLAQKWHFSCGYSALLFGGWWSYRVNLQASWWHCSACWRHPRLAGTGIGLVARAEWYQLCTEDDGCKRGRRAKDWQWLE